MADQIPISGLAADATPLATDLIPVVDTTDHTQAPTGTTKKMTRTNFITGLLQSVNDLSDVSSVTNSVNNLQFPRGYLNQISVTPSTLVLTNPCPSVINIVATGGNVTVNLPIMNSVTANSKSIGLGEMITIINSAGDDISNIEIKYQDGTAAGITAVFRYQYVEIYLYDNSTANGLVQSKHFGPAASKSVSDVTKFYLASLDNPTVAYTGKIPVYTDSNGTLGSSGIVPPTTDGQLIIGKTSDVAQVATLTGGTGISITNGPGSITISATGGGVNVVTVTTATQALAVNTKYFIEYASGLCTLTLPASFGKGDEIGIRGNSAGGWTVIQNSGQNIRMGSVATTTTTGSLSSNNRYDTVNLEGFVTDTTMTVTAAQTAGFGVV